MSEQIKKLNDIYYHTIFRQWVTGLESRSERGQPKDS